MAAFGCAKDELTKPAAVKLQMQMTDKEVNMRKQQQASYIKIEKAYYSLSEIEFEGYRQNAQDYFFTKEFEEGMEIRMENGNPSSVISFDMPQGAYDRIKITYRVKKRDLETAEGKKALDPYNSESAIIMEGFYLNARQQQIPLLYVYNFDETFEQVAVAGKQQLVVEKDRNSFAVIEFDPDYWMQHINGRMLQGAGLTEVNGRQTIILSEEQNEHIFNLLTSRMKDASKLSFN